MLAFNPQKRSAMKERVRKAASSPHAAQSRIRRGSLMHSLLAMPSRRQQPNSASGSVAISYQRQSSDSETGGSSPTSPFRTPASTSTNRADPGKLAAAPPSNPSHRSPTPPPTPSTGRDDRQGRASVARHGQHARRTHRGEQTRRHGNRRHQHLRASDPPDCQSASTWRVRQR